MQNTSNCSQLLPHVQCSEGACSSARTGYVFFGTLVFIGIISQYATWLLGYQFFVVVVVTWVLCLAPACLLTFSFHFCGSNGKGNLHHSTTADNTTHHLTAFSKEHWNDDKCWKPRTVTWLWLKVPILLWSNLGKDLLRGWVMTRNLTTTPSKRMLMLLIEVQTRINDMKDRKEAHAIMKFMAKWIGKH